jgi:hypothetical protein
MAKAKKNKKTTQSHKRTGSHQKRTPNFMKTYWPYLPMVVGAGIFIVVGVSWKIAHSNLAQNNNGQAAAGISEKALQQKINALEQKQSEVINSKLQNPKGD